jgi:acetyl esterase/lipase
MKIKNLGVLCAIACVSAAIPMVCQQTSAKKPVLTDPGMGLGVLLLHESSIPIETLIADSDTPMLTIFPPQPGRANGTAVVVAPGGSYRGLAGNLEGRQVADWFAARGITAFLLRYRVGGNNVYPVPLQDAQRAIRLVRASTATFGISANRIGMIGFSAGGHLTAMTGTSFDDGNAVSPDPIERVSDRPDFLILGYPWLNAMLTDDRGFTYCSVMKTIPPSLCKEFEEKYTPTRHVTKNTPPTFIYITADDETVPAQASVDFYEALRAADVDAELHIFRHGAHGSGLGDGKPALDLWPVLLEQWLRDLGYLSNH